MAVSIPLQPIANQTLQANLGGQATTINVYQEAFGLFVDVLVSGSPIITGVIAQDANLIVRDVYLGFSGDLVFLDLVNVNDPSDPVYTGLGSRFQLFYLTPADLAELPLPVNVG